MDFLELPDKVTMLAVERVLIWELDLPGNMFRHPDKLLRPDVKERDLAYLPLDWESDVSQRRAAIEPELKGRGWPLDLTARTARTEVRRSWRRDSGAYVERPARPAPGSPTGAGGACWAIGRHPPQSPGSTRPGPRPAPRAIGGSPPPGGGADRRGGSRSWPRTSG